jgi:hypothetical protein
MKRRRAVALDRVQHNVCLPGEARQSLKKLQLLILDQTSYWVPLGRIVGSLIDEKLACLTRGKKT